MLQRLRLATFVVAVCSTALASAASSGMREARDAGPPARDASAAPGLLPATSAASGWLLPTAQHHQIVAGDLARSLAAADLDGDGTADIVTGNELSLTVGVVLSRRNGRMADIVHYPIGSAADASLYRVQVAVGHLVGNRHPDIVAAGFSRNTLEVFVGQGKGQFAAPIQVTLQNGDEPTSVAVGDVDHDGDQDIVTGDGFDRAVSVLLGDGKGTFSAPHRFPTGAVAGHVVVADATRDGHLDILSAGGSDGVALLAGTGTGSFAAPVLLSAGPETSVLGLAVADATGDGRVDLVTANQATDGDFDAAGSVSVLRGERAGGFGSARILSVGKQTLGRVESVAVADVTGDGHPDIVAGHPVDGVLTLLAGDRTRGFLHPVSVPAAGGAADPVLIADVTGDRRPDVITSVFVGRNEMLSILPSDGAGRIGIWGNHDTRLQLTAESVVGRDLDGDRRADVASIGITPDGAAKVAVRMGRHRGGLSEPVYFDLDANAASGIASGDFNKDRTQDLVVVTHKYPENGVSVLLGNRRGGFSAPRRYPIELELQGSHAVAVADLDGDGHLDIATSNIPFACLPGDPDCSPPDLGSVSILRGDGRGGFGAQVQIEGVAASPRAIAAADVTGDGRADLVVPHFGVDDFGLRVLAGDGNGGFADPVHLDTDIGPVAVVVADVTGDAFPDLLSLNHTAQSVSLLTGDGTGRFNPATHFPLQLDRDVEQCAPGCPWLWPWPWGLAVGDINGDGAPDIVTANTDNGTLTVLRNRGRGEFSAAERVDTGGSPRAVALADVTGDGKVDVVAANSEGAISVHANAR